ncbi:MAG: DUF523 domain-containing protein [Gammaproteobacteria bacterium]|nr:DUF523 domain-containing protein [Gammaproteobacteria bacterium]
MKDDHSHIVLGVSACLLGEKVRYDGNHSLCQHTAELEKHFKFITICPELEIGLGVPRPPIQLIKQHGHVRVIGKEQPHTDYTDDLHQLAKGLSKSLHKLSGYVFKSQSPSCGIGDVKLYDKSAGFNRTGTGEYAATIIKFCPWLPVTDEQQICDPDARHAFIERVYQLRRWQDRHPDCIPPARL